MHFTIVPPNGLLRKTMSAFNLKLLPQGWDSETQQLFVSYLVDGFNPSEKYARQIGSYPQVGRGENKKYLKPPHSYTTLKLIITRFTSKVFVLTLGFCSHNSTWGLSKYLGVSKNSGTPKWMVYNGEPLSKWMIWGYPYFWNTHIFSATSSRSNWKVQKPHILWHASREQRDHPWKLQPHLTIQKASYEFGSGDEEPQGRWNQNSNML